MATDTESIFTCFNCGAAGKEGIRINGSFLCRDCEHLLVEMRPDADGYEELVESCKAIWQDRAK